jgi:hypothetical protein
VITGERSDLNLAAKSKEIKPSNDSAAPLSPGKGFRMSQSRKTETELKIVGGSTTPAETSTAPQSAQPNGAEPKSETSAAVKPVSAGLTAARLRIDPNAETTTVRRVLTKIPVYDKPDPQWYVRIRPGAEWRMEGLGIVKFSRDRRLYAIDPMLSEALKAYYRRHYAFVGTTITRAPFLWVIPMPGEDGSWNTWHQSKHDCGLAAMDRWLQVLNSGSQFDPNILTETKPDPDWDEWLHPCANLDQVLDLAFKSTYVNKLDHPLVEALLRGG